MANPCGPRTHVYSETRDEGVQYRCQCGEHEILERDDTYDELAEMLNEVFDDIPNKRRLFRLAPLEDVVFNTINEHCPANEMGDHSYSFYNGGICTDCGWQAFGYNSRGWFSYCASHTEEKQWGDWHEAAMWIAANHPKCNTEIELW